MWASSFSLNTHIGFGGSRAAHLRALQSSCQKIEIQTRGCRKGSTIASSVLLSTYSHNTFQKYLGWKIMRVVIPTATALWSTSHGDELSTANIWATTSRTRPRFRTSRRRRSVRRRRRHHPRRWKAKYLHKIWTAKVTMRWSVVILSYLLELFHSVGPGRERKEKLKSEYQDSNQGQLMGGCE